MSSRLQFSILEQKIIAEQCRHLLKWCQAVGKHSGIAHVLFQYDYAEHAQKNLIKYLKGAESIAGPCPWPIAQKGKAIRSHQWERQSSESDAYDLAYFAPRSSIWYVVYRSIRRHIFNRYVRQHRSCWDELKSYKRTGMQNLDSDMICPVALAYAAWRLASEELSTIEGFKIASVKGHPIRILRLDHLGIEHSLRAYSSLLYAQFFYIWEEIIECAGSREFEINLSNYVKPGDFAVVSIPTEALAKEWSVILPDYQELVKQSFLRCWARPKKRCRMIFPIEDKYLYAYTSYHEYRHNEAIFHLWKKSSNQRKSYRIHIG